MAERRLGRGLPRKPCSKRSAPRLHSPRPRSRGEPGCASSCAGCSISPCRRAARVVGRCPTGSPHCVAPAWADSRDCLGGAVPCVRRDLQRRLPCPVRRAVRLRGRSPPASRPSGSRATWSAGSVASSIRVVVWPDSTRRPAAWFAGWQRRPAPWPRARRPSESCPCPFIRASCGSAASIPRRCWPGPWPGDAAFELRRAPCCEHETRRARPGSTGSGGAATSGAPSGRGAPSPRGSGWSTTS